MNTNSIRFLALPLLLAAAAPRAHAAITVVADQDTWRSAVGASSQVDFESFVGPVTTEYPGLVFADFADGSPTSVTIYPYEGLNCLFTQGSAGGGGGGWAADFDLPTRGVAMWVGDLQFPGTTIVIYDAAHEILASYDLFTSGNGNGPAVYGFNAYLSDAADIARIEIVINADDAVWFDNVQFGTPAVSAVPDDAGELATWGQVKGLFR
jgi:hypothetical protein